MFEEVLGRPGSMGSDGLKWWIGRVAPRSAWADAGLLANDKDVGRKFNEPEIDIYYNRVKVQVVGYHDQIANPRDLPWAHILATPMLPSGYRYKDHTHYLEGGESVFGFWLDGEDEQKPVIMGVFYRHKKGQDEGTPIGSSPATSTNVNRNPPASEPTGATAGTNLGTNDPIKEQRYLKRTGGYNFVTGGFETEVITRTPITNEDSTGKGVSSAADSHHVFLKRKTNRPTCKRDNVVAEITGALGDFAEILLTVQGYANFYVNGVLGVISNLQGEIDLIAKSIASIVTGLFNSIRDRIYILVGEKIQNFINDLIPEEIKPIFGQTIKEAMDVIYCIFENLIKSLLKTIVDFLLSLVGKFINAPLCAAEQFAGALLSKLASDMSAAISPILQSLSDTLGGALGSVNEIIGKALEFVGLVFSFIGCDKLKCPLPSRWDNAYGPTQGERDSAQAMFSSISILNIPTGFDENGKPKQTVGGFLKEAEGNASSIFGESTDEQKKTAAYISGLVGGCDSKVLRCGPPKVEIFGGEGIGGFANAVVSNLGEIIGVDVVERGFGYSAEKPPYVTFRDACGDGKGARGRAVIGDDGGIDRIIIDYSGYGYRNNFGDIKTIYGTIPGGDGTTNVSNSDNKTVTGQIDVVEVFDPGFGYNPGDTLEVGNGAELTPIIIGGRILGVEVNNGGTGFTSIPEITINSETGVGANLSPVLKFTDVGEESLPPAETVIVVNCVGK